LSQETVFFLPQSSVTKFVLSVHYTRLFIAKLQHKLPHMTSEQDGSLAHFRL
jgi:hypothetical protein